MRLMKSGAAEESHTSPCSKSDLVEGLTKSLGRRLHRYPPLEKCTRTHLLSIAASEDLLADFEERANIVKILKSARIDFDASAPTYDLVRLGIDFAVERYGVADLVSLGKNLKRSPFRVRTEGAA